MYWDGPIDDRTKARKVREFLYPRGRDDLAFIDTRCIRCRSKNTVQWRVDHNGMVKFYCERCWEEYLLDKALRKRFRRFGQRW